MENFRNSRMSVSAKNEPPQETGERLRISHAYFSTSFSTAPGCELSRLYLLLANPDPSCLVPGFDGLD